MVETHIVPEVDGEEHDLNGCDCPCQPRHRPTGNGPTYTHNSFRKTGRYQIFESIPDASSEETNG
jgi:hypothetical protein